MHTKEPWIVASGSGTMIITESKIPCIAQTANDNAISDARRIVACVNACAGIDTEIIERNVGNVWKLLQQRDELLAALKDMVDYFQYTDESEGQYDAVKRAQAAISKAEGLQDKEV